jgi:hypothetical protein
MLALSQSLLFKLSRNPSQRYLGRCTGLSLSTCTVPNWKNITYDVEEEGVAVIAINRPERRNAVGEKLVLKLS